MRRLLSMFVQSLEVRMFAVVGAITISAGGALGYYIFASQQERELALLQAQLATTAQREAAAIHDRIEMLEQTGVRANAVFCSYLGSAPPSEPLMKYPRAADGAVRFHRPGTTHTLFVSKRTELTPELVSLLEQSEQAWDYVAPLVTTGFLNFYFDTPRGTHLSTSSHWIEALEPDHDFSRDVFHYAGDPQHDPEGLPRWTPVYYDSIHGKWMTTLVVPLACRGEFLGTTGSDFALDAVFQTVQRLYLREGLGKAFLFDDAGNIVVHPDYMAAINRKHAEMNARLHFNEISDPALREFLGSYRPSVNAELVGRFGPEGKRLVIAAHAIGLLDWHLGFYESEARLMQPLRALRLRVACAALLTAFLLTLALHWALSRFILAPIRGLVHVAREVGQGRLNVELPGPLRGPLDPIADGVRAFQHMIADLDELIARLSAEVKRLGASERNFRAILDGANDAIFVHELLTGKIIDVNAKVTELYGYSREEVVALGINELSSGIDPYTSERALGWLERARGGEPQLFEWQAKSRTGRVFWVEVNMRIADINGEGRILVSVRDISARRQAEEDLRATRKYLRYIFDSLPSVLVAFDRAGAITQWNRAATELTQLAEQDVRGKRLWQAVPALAKCEERVTQLAPGASIAPHKVWELLGERKHCLSVSFLALPEEAFGDIVLRIDDVTESEHKEEQLRRAQRMDTVGMLAGGLAHDLNNSIGLIMAMLSLWRSKLSASEALDPGLLHEDLSTMADASARAAETIRQLMTLARQQALSFCPVDLNELVRESVALCTRSLDPSVEIIASYFPGPAVARANATELQQILLNLCINAAHAMTVMRPDSQRWGGPLRIAIEQRSAEELAFPSGFEKNARAYWAISVSDTGVGMTAQVKANLFTPFFTTKASQGGTGLGLSMAYSIARQHGGFVDVSSEPEQGSTFWVYLPAAEQPRFAE
jgi:PAS domain S-box-containing protein